MKSRVLIIVGVIMITTISLATIAVLERYDNYLEQLEYEADAKSKEPKPGDKYYIEPERKSHLIEVEQDLRSKIRQLHENNLQTSYAVNLNYLTQKIEVIVETNQFNDKINEIISQYYDDVEIVFTNGKISIIEFEQNILDDENVQRDCFLTEYWNGIKCVPVDFEISIESETPPESIDFFSSTYPRKSSTDLPIVIIMVFALVIGFLIYWFTLRKRK